MSNVERRIASLEQKLIEPSSSLLVQLLELWPHEAAWYEELAAAANHRDSADEVTEWIVSFLEESGSSFSTRKLSVALDRGLAMILDIDSSDLRDPFANEQWRGQVPDHIIAAVYNRKRNYVYAADVSLRIRQLAGVVDENGEPLPGYVLCDNGCIIDAPEAGPATDRSVNASRAPSST